MCFHSNNYPSLYDKIFDFGVVNRYGVVSDLESDSGEVAYESEIWDRGYDLQEGEDPEEREDYDDNRPFYYGIGGGWFEFPDDVFSKDDLCFSVKRNLYYYDAKKIDFEKAKAMVNNWNKMKFYFCKHPKTYDIQIPEDLQELFEYITKEIPHTL